MAMNEFLRSVQTARNVAFPLLPSAITLAAPGADAPDAAWLRRSAPVWLAPHTVAAFDANDFPMLPEDARDQLAAAVRDFRAVAEAVAGRDPTDAELRTAFGHLGAVIALLDRRFFDAEGKAFLLALYRSKVEFPEFILGLDYDLDTDWAGAPGVWIFVIVPDEVDAETEPFIRFSREFLKDLWRALHEAKSDRLPYVQYRLLSEVHGLVNEDAE
ncbi:unnamed protein product [Gemmataceae bacterium]|nr:unnamed protein product [Gemmataceae bacterium]VTU00680.1 unnamed protein product [Gemmataceae bacterium]